MTNGILIHQFKRGYKPSYVINTIGWEKGIYIVNVIIDKQVLTEKITVN